LKTRLYQILGLNGQTSTGQPLEEEKPKAIKAKPAPSLDDDDDEEGMEFFKKLAQEE